MEEIEISDDSGDQAELGKRRGLKREAREWRSQHSRQTESPSPIRSILKTSPMYSPIKTASKNRGITIREELNTLKNFAKDPSLSEESPRRKPGKLSLGKTQPLHHIVDIADILNVGAQLTSRPRLRSPGPSVLKSTSQALKHSEVIYSNIKPTYVTRYPNDISRSVCRHELSAADSHHKDPFAEDRSLSAAFSDNRRDQIGKSPIKRLISEKADIGANYEEFRREIDLLKNNAYFPVTPGRLQHRNRSPAPQPLSRQPREPDAPSKRSTSPLSHLLSQSPNQQEALFVPETVDYSQSAATITAVQVEDQLISTEPSDVRESAELLLEILKSFSLSFNLDLREIVGTLSQIANDHGFANIDELRKRLVKKTALS